MANIEVATFEQIATLLAQLSNNYSNLAIKYYDIFYNPIPQDVSINLYDDSGVLHEYLIPNRAKDFRFVLNGEGEPEGSVSASVGSTYQDTLNGKFYIKQLGSGNKGWVEIASSESFLRGEGSPENVLAEDKGILYVDILEGTLYIKTTSTGNTGWVAFPKTGDFVDVNLSNLSSEGENHFANLALSNLNPLGENHFANLSLSNLNNLGNSVINNKEDKSNKVSALSANSTNTQYPSAKVVYDVTTDLKSQMTKRADLDLSNLSETGQNKIANRDLSNLTTAGNNKFNNKANVNLSNLDATGKNYFANKDLSNLTEAGNARFILNSSVKSYVSETFVDGTSGYRIWSDKYCEQWGIIRVSSDRTADAVLLKPLKDTNYMCQGTIRGSFEARTDAGVGVYPIDKTKIRVLCGAGGGAGTYPINWYVCGYLE